jgi:LuxR family maltose regulon positive regulatory protein
LRSDCKLILISAPAGYGKTTLLSKWVRDCKQHVAWVSLDKGDNDPDRFLLYVIGALHRIKAGIGEQALVTLQSPQPISYEPLLTSLINDITETAEPLVLILDDFHLITERRIHDALTFLLDNLPPLIHLIISGRADPPWPLGRLRARNEMTELRTNDLRFTSQEVATFLNEVMQLNLSPEDVTVLEAHTEGWIAGLQMAALSMRGREDVSAFISAFTGSHRFILDFLVEEVLEQQPPNVQQFLFKTSILERMTAPLCDAVTGSSDSQTILAQLDQANLFLIPLDDDRRWYRYHHLFADLLHSHLMQAQLDQVPTLHHRASAWYERNESVDEAVRHAFAADDLERVVHLVEEHALTMVYQGQLATLASWLARIPTEAMNSRPWLCIAQAWTMVYKGQLDAVEPLLQTAEETLAAEGQRIKGHIAAIRAYAAFLRWDARAMEFAREALAYLSEDDLMVRGLAAMVLAIGYFGSGDLAAAEQAFDEAIVAGKATNDRYVAINALCELSDLQTTQGRLHKAAATCRDALQMADASRRQGGKRLPIAGYTLGRLSVVLSEWNDLPIAKNHAQECVELSKHWGQADAQILAHSFLAGASLANGDTDGALDAIRTAKQMAEMVSPRYRDFVAAREASVLLATGDVTAATRWMTESGLSVDDDPYRPIRNYIVLARVLIAQAQLEKAMRLLAQLLKMAEVSGAMGYVIELSILQALTLQAVGKADQALDPLERALSLAEPEGFVRIFINEGAPMGRLLRQAIAKGIGVAYAGRLFTALGADAESRLQPGVTARAPMVDPLSEREIEVMRLLTTHLSSTDIAGELTISVNTARTHIKSIYGKLGVHSREEAVQKAEEHHLL